ncbi:MAG: hypothetical protein UY65_C0001G0002 [Parcubacteria group bacterium GW2011_GWA2_51_12]|nr:MAG: hypothetical protein UY65_C0001G0002 [Parcubacteria group bacterium GW2011_GWA2_51_12]
MRPTQNYRNKYAGLTLIEAVVGTAVFAILLSGILGSFAALSRVSKINREQTILTTLATNYLEVVRNLPYSEVGTINGNPSGGLWDLPNAQTATIEGKNFEIYYEVTYTDDPSDGTIFAGTDTSPNDYKQVKMFVQDIVSGKITSFSTNVSPKGLEGLEAGGALSIEVFNAQGQPVPNASVHIENLLLNPSIILDRTTDSTGRLIEVGLPASVNGYHVVVTKAGYSTDQTHPITLQNPNPLKPDATIVAGQVTEISFSIDLLSNLNIYTLDRFCQNLNGIGVNVHGAKLIGTSPDIFKFDQNYASINGLIDLPNIEWDTYTPTLLTGQSVIVYGTSPIQSIDLLPGTTQSFTMILGPNSTANSLLVIVKDAATGVAVEGADVHLIKGDSTPQDYYGTTSGSVWVQTDWTGGAGQDNFIDDTKYFTDDGSIDINSTPTGVRLKKITGQYVLSGELISSNFDTGSSATDFTTISWQPTSQHPATELKFQIATNNDNATWDYRGPDGTPNTYYTVPGTTINTVHDDNRYIRYRALLSTTDDKHTPILTSLTLNYVSGCFTPGQVIFTDLTAGNNYDINIAHQNYQTVNLTALNIFGNQILEVLMSP